MAKISSTLSQRGRVGRWDSIAGVGQDHSEPELGPHEREQGPEERGPQEPQKPEAWAVSAALSSQEPSVGLPGAGSKQDFPPVCDDCITVDELESTPAFLVNLRFFLHGNH